MATAGGSSEEACFEIGLVMAGALSAGSYTARVVDFLIQALDQWHEGKRGDDARCPRHRISLKVIAGASAGGMSAAIAAAQFGEAHTPADDPGEPGPLNNKLFDSWVRRIDISRFLDTADLDADPDSDVASLLDSTVLDEIAAATFRREDGPPPPERSYVADPLHVLLTVTTIQGIPYAIRFIGDRADPPQMSMHGDYLHFALGDARGLGPEVRPLHAGQYQDPEWKAFSLTALATGACPVLFAPRKLIRKIAEYSEREWPIAAAVVDGGRIARCGQFRKIPPDFPESTWEDLDSGLEVVAVDGGLNDNEPLKLARRIIDRDHFFSPESRGDRALIAVAPFPDVPTFAIPQPPIADPIFLTALAGALAGIINQARFDPKVAVEERDPNALNRYVISPSRDCIPDARIRSHLAGGAVGGLGDFLAHEFRAHDFQLGRRNCHQFLRDVFGLPEEGNMNPLFDSGWTEEARSHYRFVKGLDGLRRPPGSAPVAGDKAYLPIIPLWGTAVREVPQMEWPRYDPGRLDTLRSQVEKRTHAVVRRLIDRHIPSPLHRLALRGALRFLKRRLADKIIRNVAKDLDDRGLLGRTDRPHEQKWMPTNP